MSWWIRHHFRDCRSTIFVVLLKTYQHLWSKVCCWKCLKACCWKCLKNLLLKMSQSLLLKMSQNIICIDDHIFIVIGSRKINPVILHLFSHCQHMCDISMTECLRPGIILWMHPASERRRYIVTSSLIGWVHTQNNPWYLMVKASDLVNNYFSKPVVISQVWCCQCVNAFASWI